MGTALATGQLPVRALRAQLGRGALEPTTPGVPEGLTRQLVRFGAVGIASTLAYLVLYLLMHPAVGAQGANALALLLTAVANTAANRRLTFGVTGRAEQVRHHVQGLAVFGVGLALTSGSLALLHAGTEPARGLELTVLVAANLAATLLRFLLLRRWVFRGAIGVSRA